MPMNIVFIDNMVLSWLMQDEPVEGEEDRWRRANQVPEQAQAQDEVLAIAAPALAEFLTQYEKDHHTRIIAELGKSFQIHAFDAAAASVAAALRRAPGKKQLAWKEARDASGLSSHDIKSDITIVATAISSGAKGIVTHDTGILTLAEHPYVRHVGFEVRGLPAVQTKLFSSDEE